VLAAEGYEFERTCGAPDSDMVWNERVMVVRSPMHATQQAAGLETRLRHAETKLAALTPPRGRGKRQITDEATLVEAIGLVLTEHRVDGLLSVTWEKQVEQTTQYVGRGRGSVSREKRVIQKTRYHITHIARQADTIAALSQRLGWKAFVTNAGQKRLSLHDAVLCYRNEYRAWNASSTRAWRSWGKPRKSTRMTRTLYLPLKPGEALLCASNCNSSFVTMMVRKKLLPMSSPSIKTTNALSISG
jgi:hypothetical protein